MAGAEISGGRGDNDTSSRQRTPNLASAPEVVQLAGRLGLGPARGTHPLSGNGASCLGVGIAIVLLGPGIGLVSGAYGLMLTTLGAVCLIVAVSLVPLALLFERRRANQGPQLHLFDGGMVIARFGEVITCPWSDVRLVGYTYSAVAGGQGTTRPATGTRLEHVDGRRLCSLGRRLPSEDIIRIAAAGGARTAQA